VRAHDARVVDDVSGETTQATKSPRLDSHTSGPSDVGETQGKVPREGFPTTPGLPARSA